MKSNQGSGLLVTSLVVAACNGGTPLNPEGNAGQADAGVGEYCQVDGDCVASHECIGARNCPPGAYCILPAAPGTCQPIAEVGGAPGSGGAGNEAGAVNQGGSAGAVNQGGSAGAVNQGGSAGAVNQGGSAGAVSLECRTDNDCDVGERCQDARVCPEGVLCILPPKPGICSPKVPCATASDCAPGEVCEQVFFPILPPPGYDAGTGGIVRTKLGECTSNPGVVGANEPTKSVGDDWWQAAEDALRIG